MPLTSAILLGVARGYLSAAGTVGGELIFILV
jgi:hypothetical protein